MICPNCFSYMYHFLLDPFIAVKINKTIHWKRCPTCAYCISEPDAERIEKSRIERHQEACKCQSSTTNITSQLIKR